MSCKLAADVSMPVPIGAIRPTTTLQPVRLEKHREQWHRIQEEQPYRIKAFVFKFVSVPLNELRCQGYFMNSKKMKVGSINYSSTALVNSSHRLLT